MKGYELVITEVKVESDGTIGETVPFVEIYNPYASFAIALSDIGLHGVVEGRPSASNHETILPQGNFLVLYDALYKGTDSSNSSDSSDSGVTCQDCQCTKQSNINSNHNHNHCNNSIYIACDGSHNHPCTFSFWNFTNTNWYLKVEHNTSEMDIVTWDSSFPNLTNSLGYSYELISMNESYNNDDGQNWEISCNIFGTPGAVPIRNCTQPCDTELCQANGVENAIGDATSGICDCSGVEHYYPSECSCQLGLCKDIYSCTCGY